MYINRIKIGNSLLFNIDHKNGEEWNVPSDIDNFKSVAVDTIKTEIGIAIKRVAGNTATNLSAVNSKAITLLARIVSQLQPNISFLSENEKRSFNRIIELGEKGYSDSLMLVESVESIIVETEKGYQKISRILASKTHEEIITILNE